jgi:hypothetical protein
LDPPAIRDLAWHLDVTSNEALPYPTSPSNPSNNEMSTTEWPSKVVPAQLAFLAIYNPTLGPTDETFRDQLVFYYSRTANEARVAARKSARNDSAGGDAVRLEENEKLRQIGLAQGMVDFAK